MSHALKTYTTASISLMYPCEWIVEQKRDAVIFTEIAGVVVEMVCVHKSQKVTLNDYVYFARSLMLKHSPPVDFEVCGFHMHRYDYEEGGGFCVALIFGIEEVIFRFIIRMKDAQQVGHVEAYIRPLLENLMLLPDRIERRKKMGGRGSG